MADTKAIVGEALASRVKDGEIIGVGTGTTVEAALRAIHQRIQNEGISVKVVPTSYQSAWKCEEIGLDVLYSGHCGRLAWGFDGADEVDPKLRLIKGRGGAHLQEKIIAAKCESFVVVVGDDKLVDELGAFPVPVELHPDARGTVEAALNDLGAKDINLRIAEFLGRNGPYFTQSGNIILDASFSKIADDLESQINAIPGVLDNGIFTNFASEILIGSEAGTRSLFPK